MKIKLYKDVVETLEDSKLNPTIKEDTFYLLQDLNNNIENLSTPKAMSYITNRSAYGVEHDGIHRFAIRRDKIYKVQRLYFYFEDDTVWFEKLVLKDKRKSQDKDIKYCINLRDNKSTNADDWIELSKCDTYNTWQRTHLISNQNLQQINIENESNILVPDQNIKNKQQSEIVFSSTPDPISIQTKDKNIKKINNLNNSSNNIHIHPDIIEKIPGFNRNLKRDLKSIVNRIEVNNFKDCPTTFSQGVFIQFKYNNSYFICIKQSDTFFIVHTYEGNTLLDNEILDISDKALAEIETIKWSIMTYKQLFDYCKKLTNNKNSNIKEKIKSENTSVTNDIIYAKIHPEFNNKIKQLFNKTERALRGFVKTRIKEHIKKYSNNTKITSNVSLYKFENYDCIYCITEQNTLVILDLLQNKQHLSENEKEYYLTQANNPVIKWKVFSEPEKNKLINQNADKNTTKQLKNITNKATANKSDVKPRSNQIDSIDKSYTTSQDQEKTENKHVCDQPSIPTTAQQQINQNTDNNQKANKQCVESQVNTENTDHTILHNGTTVKENAVDIEKALVKQEEIDNKDSITVPNLNNANIKRMNNNLFAIKALKTQLYWYGKYCDWINKRLGTIKLSKEEQAKAKYNYDLACDKILALHKIMDIKLKECEKLIAKQYQY